MYRNLMNRCWTLAIACMLGLGLLATVPARSVASSVAPSGGQDPDPAPNASGDPDSPSNTGRPTAAVRRGNTVGSLRQASAGPSEAWTPRNAMVIKIRIALQMVRVFYLHD